MSAEQAGGTPGPAVSDRMRALLSRAAEEQLLEQRQVSAVLGELRALVADVDERLATGEQVERVAEQVRVLSARLDEAETRSADLAERITDATAMVGRAAEDLVAAVAARVGEQLAEQLAEQVAALEAQAETRERRLAGHVDDAVLALAEVVLRRGRPVPPTPPAVEPAPTARTVEQPPAAAGPAASLAVAPVEDEPTDTEPADTDPAAADVDAPAEARPDVDASAEAQRDADAAADRQSVADASAEARSDVDASAEAPPDVSGEAKPTADAPAAQPDAGPAQAPPDAPPVGAQDPMDVPVADDLVPMAPPTADDPAEPFPGDGYVLVPADVADAEPEPAPPVQLERRTADRRSGERSDGSGRRRRPWWRRA